MSTKIYEVSLTVDRQNHPNQALAQNIKQGKAFWTTWQDYYVGPLKPSHGKKYILVWVEVVSGLLMAAAVCTATGNQTI